MLHGRAFRVSVVWTLVLLFLGSVVHATESSLACPDWPTCFGTMVPEMTGGVFWEHLHRLVAGGLLLMWGLATWLAHREAGERPWIFRASLAGVALLLIQSLFGGLTVLYRLPDLVSTTHLALALSFLVLATVLAAAARGEDAAARPSLDRTVGSAAAPPISARRLAGRGIRRGATVAAALVFVQSVLGGLVRHMDAGMACPDAPLCLGQVVPPLVNAPITVHFVHRLLGVLVAIAVCAFGYHLHRSALPHRIRRWAVAAVALVLTQVGLGFASVLTVLAVAPVSLHTLVAASLLSVLAHVATVAVSERQIQARPASAPAA
jgi:heme A synthase